MRKGISIGQLLVNNSVDDNYNPLPDVDAKYGPYNSIAEALKELPPELRSVGLTVGIKQNNIINEYWFNGGIENKNLVVKQQGSGNEPVQTVYIQDNPPANTNAL